MNKLELTLGLAVAFVLSLGTCHGLMGPLELKNLASLDSLKYDRPIVSVEVGKKNFSVPVYRDVRMSELRREIDRNMIEKMAESLRELTQSTLIKRQGSYQALKIVTRVTGSAIEGGKKLAEARDIDTSPKMAGGYGREMSYLLIDILHCKTNLEVSSEEAYARANNLIDAVVEIVKESPTGLYLDWFEFKVDDESMIDYSCPIIKWFKENGYKLPLGVFKLLANIMKRFSAA